MLSPVFVNSEIGLRTAQNRSDNRKEKLLPFESIANRELPGYCMWVLEGRRLIYHFPSLEQVEVWRCWRIV